MIRSERGKVLRRMDDVAEFDAQDFSVKLQQKLGA